MFEKKGKIVQIIVILAISFFFYRNLIDNFFVWDDFFWLYRAKTLMDNPLQMFDSEGNYFRPMIYIFFWINYTATGLDYKSYNLIDIFIHSTNALLVYIITIKITREQLTAFISALLFATAFSATNAVMWISARTDLLCVFFGLLSIIFHILYLERDKKLFYIAAILAFVFALASKGTIVIFPLIILLVSRHFKKMQSYSAYSYPFIALSVIYFMLLYLLSSSIPETTAFNLNARIYNFLLGLGTLFLPYNALTSHGNLIYLVPFIIAVITFISRASSLNFGLWFIIISLLPLLNISAPYVLSGWGKQSYTLIGSPSNRVYLASIGAAIFISCTINQICYKILSNNKSRAFLQCIVMVFILYINYEIVQEIERFWNMEASRQENLIMGLKKNAPHVEKESTIVLITIPPISPAFAHPMLKVYYDDTSLLYASIPGIPADLPDNPNLINTTMPDNLHAFASLGNYNNVYNVTPFYREALQIAFKYKYSRDEIKKMEYKENYKKLAKRINLFTGYNN